MIISPFEFSDLQGLPELQPVDWADLRPRFDYFAATPFCEPVKGVIDGTMVAVGTTIYHMDTVWLACIITHPEFRNKGLGKKLTQYLLDSIDKQQYKTIYLDATEMGYPVYVKLGFEVETAYLHYTREASTILDVHTEKYQPEFGPMMLALDRMATGEDRRETIEPHFVEARLIVKDGLVTGFYLPTLSDGLIIATDQQTGQQLIQCRAMERDFAVLPQDNLAGNEFVKTAGFYQFRQSRRMRLGLKRDHNLSCIYNRISGALG